MRKVLVCLALALFLTPVIASALTTQNIEIIFEDGSVKNADKQGIIKDDINKQLDLLSSYLQISPNTLTLRVYPDFNVIPHYSYNGIYNNEIHLVMDERYLDEIGKAKPAFSQFIAESWPNCADSTRAIIATYLSNIYLEIDSPKLAADARYYFARLSIPNDPDMVELSRPILFRACAKLDELEHLKGKDFVSDLLTNSLTIGFNRAVESKLDMNFKTFIRSAKLPMPEISSRNVLQRIESLRAPIMNHMPSRPIPTDFQRRESSLSKLDYCWLLYAKKNTAPIETTIKEIQTTLQVKNTQNMVWWIVAVIAWLMVGGGFYTALSFSFSSRKGGLYNNQRPAYSKTPISPKNLPQPVTETLSAKKITEETIPKPKQQKSLPTVEPPPPSSQPPEHTNSSTTASETLVAREKKRQKSDSKNTNKPKGEQSKNKRKKREVAG